MRLAQIAMANDLQRLTFRILKRNLLILVPKQKIPMKFLQAGALLMSQFHLLFSERRESIAVQCASKAAFSAIADLIVSAFSAATRSREDGIVLTN
ncbi:hypothetical protein D3C86_1420120 [compost metagenome]